MKSLFEEVMDQYMNMMKEAPSACQSCERRHFRGCDGCINDKYWKNKTHSPEVK